MQNEAAGTTSLIWHYTKGLHIRSILDEGSIRLATGHCEPNERPAVWFSSNHVWEQSVYGIEHGGRRPRIVTRDELCGLVGGLFRIGVRRDVAPYNWDDFKRLSGISTGMAQQLRHSAYLVDARISEWFVSFEPVTSEKWVSIESWNGKSWECLPHLQKKGVDAQQAA